MTDLAYIQSPVQSNLNLPSHLTSYYHKLHQLNTFSDWPQYSGSGTLRVASDI